MELTRPEGPSVESTPKMLPTSGLFKDIDCPYYDNYCGRPYCHFRHRKRNPDSAEDSQDGEIANAEYPTYKPTPKSQLAQAKSHIPISYVPDTVVRPERLNRMPSMYNYMEKITYKPTPLSELSKNNAISTTAELINKELFSKIADNKEIILLDSPELKGNGNCDIDFEELSMEFDMIDDIINEDPPLENNDQKEEEKTSTEQAEAHKSSINESNKPPHSSKSSKTHSSKHKEDKSRHSKSKTTTTKSSHKSKSSDHRKSRSKSIEEQHDTTKHKEDKKHDKTKDRSKSSSSTKDIKESDSRNKHHKSGDSKKSSRSSSSTSSKHKEYDKSKRKEKEKSTTSREKKESKSSSKSTEISTAPVITVSDNDDIFTEDLEEECYRIFNEYKPEPVEKPDVLRVDVKQQEAVEEYVPMAKKRIAHMGAADQYVSKVNPPKAKPTHNAAMQMASRYKMARDSLKQDDNDIVALLDKHGTKRQSQILETYKNMKKAKMKHEVKEDSSVQIQEEASTSLIDDIINGKNSITYKPTPIAKLNVEEAKCKPLRIAPAMNVFSIQQAKARIAEMSKRKEIVAKTPVQTIVKGNKRVAHIPDTSLGELPDVLQPDNKKIPVNVRTRYLTMIADECVKLYVSKEDAYNRAVNEEFKVLERCAAIVTYRNSAMLAINRIRKEVQDRETKGLGPICSDESDTTIVENQFRGKRFYGNISIYVLKEEDLIEHGYPREGPVAGKAVIKNQKQMPRVNLDENQRLCCRCFKVYLVDDHGYPFYKDDCIYHPLKRRTLKGERIYLCCKSTDETGCVTSNTHVSESDDSDLLGYQTTMDPEYEDDPKSYAVYALDCEMCYTTKGLELTRVTIIDPDCKTVYESLVKPLNPIIDYNTQFSGITKDQMDRTSTSILQVQANILHLCNSKTILIGHSLESDMKALKIVHGHVIDTSILFPHRLGLPHKKALRVLASEYLNKIIQSNVAGHDSAEDAITCMELVVWKLKEDLKVKGAK